MGTPWEAAPTAHDWFRRAPPDLLCTNRARRGRGYVPQALRASTGLRHVGLEGPYAVASYSFADLGMAQVMGQTKGLVKMLADRRDGRLLGVQILGHQADTLIHEAVMALAFGATAEQVARVPQFHPTLPEILTYPAEELAHEFARSTH
ncbi:MAG TPA: hypothetical protein VGW38_02825 [Chloroflexota bacterium]|nr:hypothetical protein [Chloroflexota bacterium]